MTLTETRQVPAVIADGGEVIPLDLSVAISVEHAGARLLAIQRIFRELRRYEGWLTQILTEHIGAVPGRTEVRVGETVWELRGEAAWEVRDQAALRAVLEAALERGDVTQQEFDEACQSKEVVAFHHGRLNALTKRIPEIDQYRSRTETPAKLRARSK